MAKKLTQVALDLGDDKPWKFVRAMLLIVASFAALLAPAGLRAGMSEVVFVFVAGPADKSRATGDCVAFLSAHEAANWLAEENGRGVFGDVEVAELFCEVSCL